MMLFSIPSGPGIGLPTISNSISNSSAVTKSLNTSLPCWQRCSEVMSVRAGGIRGAPHPAVSGSSCITLKWTLATTACAAFLDSRPSQNCTPSIFRCLPAAPEAEHARPPSTKISRASPVSFTCTRETVPRSRPGSGVAQPTVASPGPSTSHRSLVVPGCSAQESRSLCPLGAASVRRAAPSSPAGSSGVSSSESWKSSVVCTSSASREPPSTARPSVSKVRTPGGLPFMRLKPRSRKSSLKAVSMSKRAVSLRLAFPSMGQATSPAACCSRRRAKPLSLKKPLTSSGKFS
mmetsp:Transcript_30486/g.96118  ORF Transcript_30486/g.96118 Transcript_30486/m.96118 type:complete len:291 (-) Transcript_30486:585-1457(-)